MRRLIAIALCVILTVSMTGCGKTADSSTDINIAIGASLPTVDPQLVAEAGAARTVSLFMSTLYGYNKDRNLEPRLAESHEVSEDGLTYTFHLREGLKWSDGRPLTARDFVFALRRLADPSTGSGAIYMITDCCKIKNALAISTKGIDPEKLGVTAPDDRTLVIELEEACPYFISLITATVFSPCNEDFFTSCKGEYATSADTLLSCGAYYIDRYEPLAVQIHLSKNPDYFSSIDHLPGGVNIQVIANGQQGVMCFDTDEFDVVPLSGSVMSWLAGRKDLRTINSGTIRFLFFGNMDKGPMKNEHIRHALTMSVDKESIAKNVIRAGSEPLNGITSKGFLMEADGSDFAKDEHRYDEYVGFNPEEAKKEWEQGLKELGTDKVEIEYAFEDGGNATVEAMKQVWEKTLPGLTVKLTPLQSKQWVLDMSKAVHDLLYAGWIPDYADPTAYYLLFRSGSHGEGGFSDPETDKLLEMSGSKEYALDPEKRIPVLHKIEDRLMEKAAMLPLFSEQSAYLVDEAYPDFDQTPTGLGYVLDGLERRE